MLDAHCPACDAVGLYPISHIVRMVNSPLGIELTVRCWCGNDIELLLGRGPRDVGRPAAAAQPSRA